MRFAQDLGPGWNLGNALDAHDPGFSSGEPADYEQLWHNPPVTPALFQTVRGAGFKTVRIPVTWYPHMGAGHQVDPAWMERVNQVVDAALDAGLYVILNAHHEDWYAPYPDNLDYAAQRLAALWDQVARQFANYDDRLLFEGMNEPRLVGDPSEWTGGTPEARAGVNLLNQTFVDTVRAAGGQNAKRYLLVPTYAAAITDAVCADFVMPQDARVMVSLHAYQPLAFTHPEDAEAAWSAEDPADAGEAAACFSVMTRYFIDRDIPVVVTEFGAVDKDNRAARLAWTDYWCPLWAGRGIPCLWWDNGAGGQSGPLGTFALLDRASLAWYYPDIAEGVVAAYPED